MKRIAVASDGKDVSQHFGHCEGFTLAVIEENQVSKVEFEPNPGHKPGFLPKFLAEKRVEVIISGGMGGSAINIFNDNNIDVITGASGNVSKVIDDYLKGELTSNGSPCKEHLHKGDCGNH